MSEWREYNLGEIAEVVPGYAFKGKDFTNNGVPIVKIGNINPPLVNLSECQKIAPEKVIGLGKFKLTKGDFVLAMTGATIGKVGRYVSEEIGYLNQRVAKFNERPGISDKRFLYHLITSHKVSSEIINRGLGSAQPNVSGRDIESIIVDIPPLPTQKAIAEILSSLDDKIELNNQINQNLEALAQALFKQWFVDFEFPNENGEPYKSSGGEMIDSELGEIPKGWEVENLEKFGEVICGKTPSKADTENFGYDVPFVKIPDMHGKVFITETTESLSIKGANSQRKKLLPKGSVMVSSIATVGLVALNTRNSQTNQQINSIIPNSSILTYFLYFLCLELKPIFLNLASGGAVTLNMNTSTFKGIKVTHPDSEVLKYFHERVDPIFEQILNLQIENEQLISLRDTLLPKLISGELEVNESLLEPTF